MSSSGKACEELARPVCIVWLRRLREQIYACDCFYNVITRLDGEVQADVLQLFELSRLQGEGALSAVQIIHTGCIGPWVCIYAFQGMTVQ